jgi:hypothetical protein
MQMEHIYAIMKKVKQEDLNLTKKSASYMPKLPSFKGVVGSEKLLGVQNPTLFAISGAC